MNIIETNRKNLKIYLQAIINGYEEYPSDIFLYNSKGHYVHIYLMSEYDIGYDIYIDFFAFRYNKPLDGGAVILQIDTCEHITDEDEIDSYIEDYKSFLENEYKYLNDKVDYIIQLIG